MGIEDILAEFDNEKRSGTESPEWKKLFVELCQEAIRLGMEMNNQYSHNVVLATINRGGTV